MKVKQKKNVLSQPQRRRRHTQEVADGGKALKAQSPLYARGQASYSREVEDSILPPLTFGTQRSQFTLRDDPAASLGRGMAEVRNLAFWG